MNKTLLYTTALILIAMPVFAQQATSVANVGTLDAAQDPLMEQVSQLQTEWARIKYQIPDKDVQLSSIHALEQRAATITEANPSRPEAKIWEGIILSTDAGIVKGMSALGKVEKAKELFEAALKQDPHALDGSAYTSLGSLYYQVPGWPLAFGDDEKAEINLKQALQINPDGIDSNYFYGDFLLQDGRYEEAQVYLERALRATARPGRELADAGRRQEIKAALSQLDQREKQVSQKKYN